MSVETSDNLLVTGAKSRSRQSSMLLRGARRSTLPLLLVCLPLLASCVPKQQSLPPAWTPQSTPQILPLPSEAKQQEPTAQCSPTCSEVLQKKLDIMLDELTKATGRE